MGPEGGWGDMIMTEERKQEMWILWDVVGAVMNSFPNSSKIFKVALKVVTMGLYLLLNRKPQKEPRFTKDVSAS